DGPDPGHAGTQLLVDDHEAAVDRDTGLLETEARRGRAASDGDEQVVGAEGLAVLEGHGDLRVVLLGLLEAGAEVVGDALAAERAFEPLAERDVLVRYEVRQRLDDRHLGAERVPHAGELDADDATAEHDDLLRHL